MADDPTNSGWALVWTGPEPTAGIAEEMLQGNGLDVRRGGTLPVRLFVPDADVPAARALLRDWGM